MTTSINCVQMKAKESQHRFCLMKQNSHYLNMLCHCCGWKAWAASAQSFTLRQYTNGCGKTAWLNILTYYKNLIFSTCLLWANCVVACHVCAYVVMSAPFLPICVHNYADFYLSSVQFDLYFAGQDDSKTLQSFSSWYLIFSDVK